MSLAIASPTGLLAAANRNESAGGGGTFAALSTVQKSSNASTTDTNSYSTTSFAATSGALVVFFFAHGRTVAVPSDATTVSGASISGATKIRTVAFNTVATSRSKVEVWAALGTGTAATVAVSYPAETQDGHLMWVCEFTNADTARGTHGVLGSGWGRGDAGTAYTLNGAAMASPADAGTRYCAVWSNSAGTGITPKTGWTEANENIRATPDRTIEVEHEVDVQDSAPTATGGASGDWAGIGLEIAAEVA